MPTLVHIDGFEHGNALSGVGNIYNVVVGSPAIVTTPVRTGARALQCSPAGSSNNVQARPAPATTVVVMSFYVRFATLPSGSGALAFMTDANGTFYFRFDQPSGKFGVLIGTGTIVTGGPTVAINTWYLVDLKADSSGATATLDCQIDGGTGFQATNAQASANITTRSLGTNLANTYTAFYDDWVSSITAADYPIGAHTVESLIINADMTHNITTAGDFDSFVTTQFDNTTTNGNTFIGHRPLQLANTAEQVIRQELGTTTNYMEFALENLSNATLTVVGVWTNGVHIESAAAGASLGEMRLLLSDNTEVLTTGSISMIDSTEDPGTAVTVRNRMAIAPTGGWDGTKVNGLKIRLGFSDNAPDVNFIDAMVDVALSAAAKSLTTRRSQWGLRAHL